MRKVFLLFVAALMLTGCSCRRSEQPAQQDSDSTEMVTIEQARQLATVAAGAIAVSDTTDTLAMQRAIIDAYATRSQMMLNGNDKAATEFDKTLEKELKRLNPELAAEVFPDNP